jgi:hypothetical protein
MRPHHKAAAQLFFLELLLMLVFFPLFYLLPWARLGPLGAPAAWAVAALGAAVFFWTLYRLRQGVEDRSAWRAEAMHLGVASGLFFWAAGIAFRLGAKEAALVIFLLWLVSLGTFYLMPPPPEPGAGS